MNDISLSANALVVIILAYSIACAFVGAAFAFGIIERRDRKAKRSNPKPTLNIVT